MIQFTFLKDHSVCYEPMDSRRVKVERKKKKSTPQREITMP